MSDENNKGDQPGKKPRAKKLSTGRPRGRPPKRVSLLAPSEIRRTLLTILDETVEVRTSKGVTSMTNFEAIFRSLVAHAAKGQPTSLIQFMKILRPALEERMKAHMPVMVAEFMREQSELASPSVITSYKDVRVQVNFVRGKY